MMVAYYFVLQINPTNVATIIVMNGMEANQKILLLRRQQEGSSRRARATTP